MSNIPATFRAFRIHNDAQGYRSGIEDISIDDLAEGDVNGRIPGSDGFRGFRDSGVGPS